MKCKKENIDKLLGSTVWYIGGVLRPRCGEITQALYDETKNDILVTINGDNNYETVRYLNRCYATLDELWDHTFRSYEADRQKIIGKIKKELKDKVFFGENATTLNYQLAYILLDYYANKQIRQYYDSEIVTKIKETIIYDMDKAIDKICDDIK